MPDTKRCPGCGESKPIDAFSTRGKRNGRQSRCRECVAKTLRERRRIANGHPIDMPPQQGKRPGLELGTRRVHRTHGYIQLRTAGHHRADRWGWVFEHILVAEEKYGIPITRDFSVHHINGDRADNRPENLELRWGNHGKGADVLPGLLRSPHMRAVARAVLSQYDDVEAAS